MGLVVCFGLGHRDFWGWGVSRSSLTVNLEDQGDFYSEWVTEKSLRAIRVLIKFQEKEFRSKPIRILP